MGFLFIGAIDLTIGLLIVAMSLADIMVDGVHAESITFRSICMFVAVLFFGGETAQRHPDWTSQQVAWSVVAFIAAYCILRAWRWLWAILFSGLFFAILALVVEGLIYLLAGLPTDGEEFVTIPAWVGGILAAALVARMQYLKWKAKRVWGAAWEDHWGGIFA